MLIPDLGSPVVPNLIVLHPLHRLHALSEKPERYWSQKLFYLTRLFRLFPIDEGWSTTADNYIRDEFVALGRNKYEYTYMLAKVLGTPNVVEAKTSFGVSMIYLALL